MVDFKISLNQNTHKPHSLRCFTCTNRINFFFFWFKWQFPHSGSWTFPLLANFRSHLLAHIPGSGTHLIGSFGGHFPPLFLIDSVTLKVGGAFPLRITWESAHFFLSSWIFPPSCRHAGLPYFILSGTTRNMSRKTVWKVQSSWSYLHCPER